MAMLEYSNIFVYDWEPYGSVMYDPEKGKSSKCIRLYGIREDSTTACLSVTGFVPYFFIALPNGKRVREHFRDCTHRCTDSVFSSDDFAMECPCIVSPQCQCPVSILKMEYTEIDVMTVLDAFSSVYTYGLYKAHDDGSMRTSYSRNGSRFHRFPTPKLVCRKRLRSIPSQGLPQRHYDDDVHTYIKVFQSYRPKDKLEECAKQVIKLQLSSVRIRVDGMDVSPIVQLAAALSIPTSGWISFYDIDRRTHESERDTHNDKDPQLHCPEFICDIVENDKILSASTRTHECTPTILCYDIEVNSANPNKFPRAKTTGDCIFMIACVVIGPRGRFKYLLTLGNPDDIDGVEIRRFSNERTLLLGFTSLVNESGAHVAAGYNSAMFDLPYILDRADIHHSSLVSVSKLGLVKNKTYSRRMQMAEEKDDARAHRTIFYTEGRVWVDIMEFVKENFKLPMFKLDFVANHFLGTGKDEVTVPEIFAAYTQGIVARTPDGLATLDKVSKYCVQDANVTLDLFIKLLIWENITEMAAVCNVVSAKVLSCGQQSRLTAQIHRYCIDHGIVPNAPSTAQAKTKYKGATVLDPKPGLYEKVVPFDFSSLYPSLMIAFNVDFMTLADSSVPDSMCYIAEWSEHVDCIHDAAFIENSAKFACADYRFRFRKDVVGVIPSILRKLLDMRAATRLEQQRHPKGSFMFNLLNTRQLSYKISANSIYGSWGLGTGPARFLEGAMSVTALGRRYLELALSTLKQEYGAVVVYGDTDSAYVMFPGKDSSFDSLWEYSQLVENSLVERGTFPPPMKLSLDGAIFAKFLILSKKRYLLREWSAKTRTVKASLDKKGVMSVRRDTCSFARAIFDSVVEMVFESKSTVDIYNFIVDRCLMCFHLRLEQDKFIFTVGVGDASKYVVKDLPEDAKKRAKRLQTMNCSEADYKFRSLPAPAQLAERMRLRGVRVDEGQRIEYVLCRSFDKTRYRRNPELRDAIESSSFQKEHASVRPLDYVYYIRQLCTSLDDVLLSLVGKPHEMTRIHRQFVMHEILRSEYLANLTPEIKILNFQE